MNVAFSPEDIAALKARGTSVLKAAGARSYESDEPFEKYAEVSEERRQKMINVLGTQHIVYVEDADAFANDGVQCLLLATGRDIALIMPKGDQTKEDVIQAILNAHPSVVLLDMMLGEKKFVHMGSELAGELQQREPNLLLIGASHNRSSFEDLGIKNIGKPIKFWTILEIAEYVEEQMKRRE